MKENPTRAIIGMMFFPFLSALGCSQDLSGSTSDPHRCNLDAECSEFNRCIDNLCVPLPLSSAVVHFELTPPIPSNAVPTQVLNVDLAKSVSSGNEVVILMSKPFHLEQVISSLPLEKNGVAGTMLVRRHGGALKRALSWNIQTGRDGKASMDLPEGRYDMLFKPQNREEFPQILLTGLILPDRMDLPIKYPIYPDNKAIAEQDPIMLVKGKVLLEKQSSITTDQLIVEGVAAFMGFETYELRSSLVTPDKAGVFFLRLPIHYQIDTENQVQTIYPTQLTLMVRPKSSSTLAPTIESKVMLKNIDLGDFAVGAIPKEYRFSGSVINTNGRPIASCQVWFESSSIANGSYAASCTTDESGAFDITIPEGAYQVTLLPPMRADAKMEIFTLSLSQKGASQQFVLPPRPRLRGTIYDNMGRFVPATTVKAKRLPDDFFSLRFLLRTFETTTNEFGTFDLGTDGGTYELTLIPPTASKLARSLPTNIKIDQAISTLPRNLSTLPPPSIIQGRIIEPNQDTPCGITIDVFTMDNQANPVLIGRAISSEASRGCDGTFRFIVPQLDETNHASNPIQPMAK